MELGLLDVEYTGLKVDVGTGKRKRLGDTQPARGQQSKYSPAGCGAQPVDRNEIIGSLEERDQLRSRVDVRD
ncbi:hypothetical protein D3C86_1849480 [compost metagenome]